MQRVMAAMQHVWRCFVVWRRWFRTAKANPNFTELRRAHPYYPSPFLPVSSSRKRPAAPQASQSDFQNRRGTRVRRR